MSVRRLSVMIAAAAVAALAASAAHAQDKGKPIDFTVRSEPSAAAPGSGKTLKWDASKGRWGLTLNMDQPEARPSTMNDVQAGAYFRITPSLSVGGSVALGDQDLSPRPSGEQADQPRVRLGTTFKF